MNKPTYTLLMWKGATSPQFCELDPDEWRNVDEHPQEYQIFIVDGHTAKVLVATWEKSLKWEDALKIAVSWVSGAYQKIEVNLKDLTSSHEDGIPHRFSENPPY